MPKPLMWIVRPTCTSRLLIEAALRIDVYRSLAVKPGGCPDDMGTTSSYLMAILGRARERLNAAE